MQQGQIFELFSILDWPFYFSKFSLSFSNEIIWHSSLSCTFIMFLQLHKVGLMKCCWTSPARASQTDPDTEKTSCRNTQERNVVSPLHTAYIKGNKVRNCNLHYWVMACLFSSFALGDVSLDEIMLKYTAARREGYVYLFNFLKISFCWLFLCLK